MSGSKLTLSGQDDKSHSHYLFSDHGREQIDNKLPPSIGLFSPKVLSTQGSHDGQIPAPFDVMRPYVNIAGLNNLSHQGLAQPDGVKVRYGSVPTIQLEDGLEEVKEEDGSVKRSLPKLPEF